MGKTTSRSKLFLPAIFCFAQAVALLTLLREVFDHPQLEEGVNMVARGAFGSTMGLAILGIGVVLTLYRIYGVLFTSRRLAHLAALPMALALTAAGLTLAPIGALAAPTGMYLSGEKIIQWKKQFAWSFFDLMMVAGVLAALEGIVRLIQVLLPRPAV